MFGLILCRLKDHRETSQGFITMLIVLLYSSTDLIPYNAF